MSHSLRRRSPLARACVLVLCALLLAMQPVAAAVGEWHELAHDPSGSHLGLVAGAVQDNPHADAVLSSDAAVAILHLLLDGAHVCGPGAAMVPLAPTVVAVPLRRPVATWLLQAVIPVPAGTPFRPPIHA